VPVGDTSRHAAGRSGADSEAPYLMTHSSEERLDDPGAESKSASARILPFQRPPTDLQRAVQMRAQEAIDRDLERDRERSQRAPVRRSIMLVLALIPVAVVVSGIDAFVRVFHHINDTYSKMPAPSEQPAVPAEITTQEPGVVMLQPYVEDDKAAAENGD
jgi:hypothetical protein